LHYIEVGCHCLLKTVLETNVKCDEKDQGMFDNKSSVCKRSTEEFAIKEGRKRKADSLLFDWFQQVKTRL